MNPSNGRKVIVQYKLKEDRVGEHEALIRAVFDELAKTSPDGIRYGAFKQADGVSYVHVAFLAANDNPLNAIAAFKAFTARIGERCVEPPKTLELTQLAAYGF
jgi:hypothetical protein